MRLRLFQQQCNWKLVISNWLKRPQITNYKLPITQSKKISNQYGVTFIEVLVTLIILSSGIVAIYQTFIISLDRLNHMTIRLYTSQALDNRISTLERTLKIYNALAYDLNYRETVDVGAKQIDFEQSLDIHEVEGLADLFEIHLTLHWQEGTKPKKLSRSAYITDFGFHGEDGE